MEINEFNKLNWQRCKRWHDGNPDKWDINKWMIAFEGEVGEACNIVKKMNRVMDHVKGRDSETDIQELRQQLIRKLVDAYCYLDLVFGYLAINKERAIALKFNEISDEYGFPEKM